MKPSELKIGLQIFIFDMKTTCFFMILDNQLFHVWALLGIHLRPFGLPWAHFGLPLGSLWAHPGPSWAPLGPSEGPQELLGASLGTILAYFDLPLFAPGRP